MIKWWLNDDGDYEPFKIFSTAAAIKESRMDGMMGGILF